MLILDGVHISKRGRFYSMVGKGRSWVPWADRNISKSEIYESQRGVESKACSLPTSQCAPPTSHWSMHSQKMNYNKTAKAFATYFLSSLLSPVLFSKDRHTCLGGTYFFLISFPPIPSLACQPAVSLPARWEQDLGQRDRFLKRRSPFPYPTDTWLVKSFTIKIFLDGRVDHMQMRHFTCDVCSAECAMTYIQGCASENSFSRPQENDVNRAAKP